MSITEDGAECKVVKLETIDWPTKLHVLVDNGKANTSPINSLRDGLKGLFEQIPEGVDCVAATASGRCAATVARCPAVAVRVRIGDRPGPHGTHGPRVPTSARP